MSEIAVGILLGMALSAIIVSQTLWIRAVSRLTMRQEVQRSRDWERLISLAGGLQELVEYRALDPNAQSLVEAAQDEGMGDDDSGRDL